MLHVILPVIRRRACDGCHVTTSCACNDTAPRKPNADSARSCSRATWAVVNRMCITTVPTHTEKESGLNAGGAAPGACRARHRAPLTAATFLRRAASRVTASTRSTHRTVTHRTVTSPSSGHVGRLIHTAARRQLQCRVGRPRRAGWRCSSPVCRRSADALPLPLHVLPRAATCGPDRCHSLHVSPRAAIPELPHVRAKTR